MRTYVFFLIQDIGNLKIVMLRLTSFIFLCAFLNSCFSSEEPCSSFHFLEKLLEKTLKMELDFNQLHNNVNTAQSSMDAALKSVEIKMETLEAKSEEFAEGLAAQLNALDEKFTNNYTSIIIQKLTERGNSPAATACPDGWTSFQNSCYIFGRDTLSFDGAQKFCQTFHANLVNIEDPGENDFLRKQLKELKAPKHWIGMTDVETEGDWKHYPSHKDVTYFDWGRHQPNNGRVSNCAAFWESFGYMWVDEPCTRNFRPICEKKANSDV